MGQQLTLQGLFPALLHLLVQVTLQLLVPWYIVVDGIQLYPVILQCFTLQLLVSSYTAEAGIQLYHSS